MNSQAKVISLQDLLFEAQELKNSGVDQSLIIEYIYSISNNHGLKMRHDSHTIPVHIQLLVPPNTPKLLPEDTSELIVETLEIETLEKKVESTEILKAKIVSKKVNKFKTNILVTYNRCRDGTYNIKLGDAIDNKSLKYLSSDKSGSVEPLLNSVICRLALSGDRRNYIHNNRTQLYYECNGVVIDTNTWKALSVPPSSFNYRPNTRIVDKYLRDELYDIIKIDDGTVVTLYFWMHPLDGPTWALASSNGYDVSSLHWMGPLTYAEIFYDLAQRLYPEFKSITGMTLERRKNNVTSLNFTNLDRNHCYTVGFRHHNFHPMTSDPERMWQIQSANLTENIPVVTFSNLSSGLPVIPKQEIYTTSTLSNEAPMVHIMANRPNMTFHDLQVSGIDALNNIKLKNNFLESYGYILRSRDTTITTTHSDILIETPLLTTIRKIIYEKAPIDIRNLLTYNNRLEYNAMRAFLTISERDNFLILYPNWADKFQLYGQFVNNIIGLIIHNLRQHKTNNRKYLLSTPIGQVALALFNHICQCESTIEYNNQDIANIVHDYVVNPEYAFLFLKAM